RPVPVQGRQAAGSAVTDGWELLVVDPAGPVTVQVPRTAVWALARGEEGRPAVLTGPDGALVVDPEIARDLPGAAAAVPGRCRAARPRSRSGWGSTPASTGPASTPSSPRSTPGSQP